MKAPVFDRVLACGTDLGLYSEEAAPPDEALGNFPRCSR